MDADKKHAKYRITHRSRDVKVQGQRCCKHAMKILAEKEGSSARLQYLVDFQPKPKRF
jgi:hypothetical protein